MAPRPCLDCGTLTATSSRCRSCESRRQHNRNARRDWYRDPEFLRNRAALLAIADICVICGNPPTDDDPLTADHIEPVAVAIAAGRQPDHSLANLRPAHRSCNSRRGARTTPR